MRSVRRAIERRNRQSKERCFQARLRERLKAKRIQKSMRSLSIEPPVSVPYEEEETEEIDFSFLYECEPAALMVD